MSLQTPLRTLIELPVSDRQVADTLLRQRARFLTLLHAQGPDGQCIARITVAVTLHAADGDGIGEPLTGPGFSSYLVELIADNNTVVDAATGQILLIRSTQTATEWLAAANAFPQAVMLQGDFFEVLRRYSPIDIEELIITHITQADAMGRFA